MNKLFIFTAGVVLGSVATYSYVKTKYEKIADAEIESVKKAFKENKKETDENEDFSEEIKDVYMNLADGYVTESEEKEDEMDKPHVISPDELGETGYKVENLTYYSDNVLTDDFDNVIGDIEATIGKDALNHFGDYGEDSVCIRNDKRKRDYEVLLDPEKYSVLFK